MKINPKFIVTKHQVHFKPMHSNKTVGQLYLLLAVVMFV